MRKVLQGLTYAGVLAFSPSVFADIPSTYVFGIDSLQTTQIQLTKATDFSTPNGIVSHQLVLQRLEALQTTVEVFVDAEVMQHVYAFTTHSPQSTSFLLQRQAFYFATFEHILREYNIPQELKYLAVIESSLIPEATSYVAAAGLWQLMPGTAAGLGLKQNEWLDERLDPVRSTEAAARYLKYLHHMFGDWKLVMGAYNCGEGVMLQAIQAAGGKYDWDSVAPHLPAQTRAYLPKFMAMLYVLNYAPKQASVHQHLGNQSFLIPYSVAKSTITP
ncbi:MAG: lytic transglycosylase domain-containing protein [Saprospiraceae bacterium]|nr:lytic transglycosylase domain-containing protein [Saprospiraceae bacterium]